MELSADKQFAKAQREEAKKLRSKIVGVGNTMDSYGEKFMSAPYEKSDRTYLNRDTIHENGYMKANKREVDNSGEGSYDRYNSSLSLKEKLGGIMDNVDKAMEKESKKDGSKREKEEEKKDDLDFDLLELEPGQFEKEREAKEPKEVNLIDG